MAATMTKRERARAALRGDRVDHVPVSLWGHDYLREWSPEALAAHTLESYRAHDWDFIKLNPRWTFFAEAWGNTYERPTEQRRPRLVTPAVTSVEDLARTAAMHPRTLQRRFKQATGLTATEYIQTARIAKARETLELTTDSVAEVARGVGYLDVSNFRRLFQRATGVTPSEYRNRFSMASRASADERS